MSRSYFKLSFRPELKSELREPELRKPKLRKPELRALSPALLLLTSLLLISCGGQSNTPTASSRYDKKYDGPPSQQVDVANIPDAVPQQTRRSKSGNPKSYVVFGKRYHVMSSSQGYKERGIASWYGNKFHGKRTSSGEPYDMHGMTAAHKTLPLPTYVKVTNLKNGRQVILKVNDRGPFHDNRIIDLSHTAAVKLGVKGTGTGLVEVEAINPGQPAPPIVQSSTPGNATISLYLQLGAFISSQNANRLKDQVNLVLSSNQANVSTILKNGQQFYRVRLGPLSDTEQADSLALTLTEKGFVKHRVVIE